MCQLTYIQTENKKIKKLLTSTLLRINASSGHGDGVGIFNGIDSIKTKESAAIADLHEIIESINNSPIIGHVRKASFGYNNKKEVEFTHPFIKNDDEKTGTLVLAHNGTLENEHEKTPKDMIDSQFFIKKFYDNLIIDNNTEKAFKKTIDEFTGKFAFLFFHNNSFYIARGKTATLYITDLTLKEKPIGFCINTELNSLNFSLRLLKDILFASDIELKFSDPVSIPIETLYKVVDIKGKDFGSSVEKCDIKFSERTKTYTTSYSKTNAHGGYLGNHHNRNTNVLPTPLNNYSFSMDSILVKFIQQYNIPILELDYIHYIVNSVGILNTNTERFETFLDTLTTLDSHTNKHKVKTFYNEAIKNRLSTVELYNKGIVPFPGWILPPQKVKKLIRGAKKKE